MRGRGNGRQAHLQAQRCCELLQSLGLPGVDSLSHEKQAAFEGLQELCAGMPALLRATESTDEATRTEARELRLKPAPRPLWLKPAPLDRCGSNRRLSTAASTAS